MIDAFVHGFLLALGLIIPLGAQNVFIFDQGVNQKRFVKALPTVFTAIICDSILILGAVLGVSLIVFAIPWLKSLILLLGVLFLFYMGYFTWFRPSPNSSSPPLSTNKQVLFTASLSFFNPHALIDTIGVIGTSSIHFSGINKIVFTGACILVSVLWFFGLLIAGHYVHKADRVGNVTKALNKVSALIIWMVAIYIGRLLYLSTFAG